MNVKVPPCSPVSTAKEYFVPYHNALWLLSVLRFVVGQTCSISVPEAQAGISLGCLETLNSSHVFFLSTSYKQQPPILLSSLDLTNQSFSIRLSPPRAFCENCLGWVPSFIYSPVPSHTLPHVPVIALPVENAPRPDCHPITQSFLPFLDWSLLLSCPSSVWLCLGMSICNSNLPRPLQLQVWAQCFFLCPMFCSHWYNMCLFRWIAAFSRSFWDPAARMHAMGAVKEKLFCLHPAYIH